MNHSELKISFGIHCLEVAFTVGFWSVSELNIEVGLFGISVVCLFLCKSKTRLLRTTLTCHRLRKAKRSWSAFFKPNTCWSHNELNVSQIWWDKWPNACCPRRTTLFLWGCSPPWSCSRTDWWTECWGSMNVQSWCHKQSWWLWTLSYSCRYSKPLHRP